MINDTYDENLSLIKRVDLKINEYKDKYDILKVSELQYERMRVAGNANIIAKTIGGMFDKGEQVLKNTLGSITPMGALQTGIGILKGKMNYDPIRGSLEREALAAWGRAVGPIEELPVSEYSQDSYRAQKVLTTTMTGFFEHKVLANIMMQRSYISPRTGRVYRNKKTPLSDIGSAAESNVFSDGSLKFSITPSEVPDSQDLRMAKNNKNTLIIRRHTRNYDNQEIKNKYYEEYAEYKSGQQIKTPFTFRIQNLASNVTLDLPAYISDVGESVSVSWESVSLLNRSEDLYVYGRAARDFNIDFFLFANSSGTNVDFSDSKNNVVSATITKGFQTDNIGIMSKSYMWKAMNFLHTLTRPAYANGIYSKAPYCRLTVADLFVGKLAIIESINISYPSLIWDLNLDDTTIGIKPMLANITMNGKILHDEVPSVKTTFY